MQAVGAIGAGEIAGVANTPIDYEKVAMGRVGMNELVVIVHRLWRSLPPIFPKRQS